MQIIFPFRRLVFWLLPALAGPTIVLAQPASTSGLQVTTVNGIVQGTLEKSGVRSFKGIPYAAPPGGVLRWKAPRPVAAWAGVRACNHFGPGAMQPPIYSDMVFRSDGMSEDCLYLNVWVPATFGSGSAPGAGSLPVLVYF